MAYALVMIVKDEAAILPTTLPSILPFISHWTVVDTGSTDGTQAIVRSLLGSVPGQLYERPWINFGHNRSEAFALAHGTGDWLLALDADMTLTIEPGFTPPDVDALMIRMGTDDFSWRLPLVIKGSIPWKSVGIVHEYTTRVDGQPYSAAPTDAIRVSYPDRSSPEKSAARMDLIEAEWHRRPDDARLTFYMAQSLRENGRLVEARAYYRTRANMVGYDQEGWYSAYRAALLAPSWQEQVTELLACWEQRTSRLEPLVDAMRLLNANNLHRAAYKLGWDQVMFIGEPPDGLFIHKSAWAWGLAFELGIAAWWIGDREQAKELFDLVLASPITPPHIRTQTAANLGYC